MQVSLVRSIIEEVSSYFDEETRIGIFWVYAIDYDATVPVMKEIFYNKNMQSIVSEEGTITRNEKGFLIKDCCGDTGLFTQEEIQLFIDLWDKGYMSAYRVKQFFK